MKYKYLKQVRNIFEVVGLLIVLGVVIFASYIDIVAEPKCEVKGFANVDSKGCYIIEDSKRTYETEVRNVLPKNEDKEFIGEASWYDYDYPKGSGNWVTKNKLVVASRDFKRGTKLRVCSDRCVEVRVTDFGPEERTGRIIDMGSLAFSKICVLKLGVCNVSVEIIN